MKLRGKDVEGLLEVVHLLASGEEIPEGLDDHTLEGELAGQRSIKVESDWLIIYRIDGNDLVLLNTGTHKDVYRSSWRGRTKGR